MPENSFSDENSLPDLQSCPLAVSSHGFSSMLAQRYIMQIHTVSSLLIRTSVLFDEGLTLIMSFNSENIHKVRISKYMHIGGWGFNI